MSALGVPPPPCAVDVSRNTVNLPNFGSVLLLVPARSRSQVRALFVRLAGYVHCGLYLQTADGVQRPRRGDRDRVCPLDFEKHQLFHAPMVFSERVRGVIKLIILIISLKYQVSQLTRMESLDYPNEVDRRKPIGRVHG